MYIDGSMHEYQGHILIKGMLDRDLIMTAAISCQFLSLLHGAFQSMSAKSGATIR